MLEKSDKKPWNRPKLIILEITIETLAGGGTSIDGGVAS